MFGNNNAFKNGGAFKNNLKFHLPQEDPNGG